MQLWLDPAVEEPRRLGRLWTPYPADEMTAYPVGTRINNPANEDPRCIEPLALSATAVVQPRLYTVNARRPA